MIQVLDIFSWLLQWRSRTYKGRRKVEFYNIYSVAFIFRLQCFQIIRLLKALFFQERDQNWKIQSGNTECSIEEGCGKHCITGSREKEKNHCGNNKQIESKNYTKNAFSLSLNSNFRFRLIWFSCFRSVTAARIKRSRWLATQSLC